MSASVPRASPARIPKLYRRLDPDEVAQRVVDTFMAIRTEIKKIMAPLGRSQSLPIGMSDALGIDDKAIAERLQINYIC
jgi:glutamate synthase (NADPH) large chain